MSAFRHLLLTRFNVRGFVAPPPDPEGWLAHRAELFERVCLPSVRGQTRRIDRWLVLFDEATPAGFRERIRRWAEWEPLVPCFVGPLAAVDAVELVRAHGGLDRPFLVTTRLDNDDALARDHVAAAGERFAEQSCLFLNFDHGATLWAGRVASSRQLANPFASLIERSAGARTVWCAEHNRLGEHGPVEHLGGPPMWLQTVHRHNVSNRRRDGWRIAHRRAGERFAIDPALLDGPDGALVRARENAGYALRRARAMAGRGRRSAAAGGKAAARSSAETSLPAASAASPRFSVVLPTAGRSALLRRALDSLAAQTWRDFEVVAVDDGSEDDTPAVLAAAAEDERLPALVALAQPRRTGVSAARNRGVRAARADWVVFFDDDDELLPDALERLAGFLAAAPADLAFTWGGVERVDAQGRPAGRTEWPAAGAPPLAHLGAGTGYALTVRRQALAAIGGFDESLAAGVDFDLLLRLGRRFRGRPLGGVLVRVHLHPAPRLTDATPAKAEAFERIERNHRVFFARHPEVGLGFLLKAARLSYAAGRRRPGRRLLLRALRTAPARLRTWKAALVLELFGREDLGLRRRLAGLGGRRPARPTAAPAPAPAPAEAAADPAGPFFSVVIPTHDRAALLPRAVASVLTQELADFELIVVDDASEAPAAATLAAIDDPRLAVVRREVAGSAAAARNEGIARAAGRWVAFLDDDDAFRPGFLAAMHRTLAAAPPEVGFAWCGVRRLRDEPDGGTTAIEEGAWQPRFADRRAAYLGFLRRRHVGTSCGLTVRRSVLAAIGGFDEALACAEDTDLLIRLARHTGFVALPEVLLDIHLHAGPRLTAYGPAMAAAYERILAKHAATLAGEPAIRAALEYKSGWLWYRAGDRRRARRHLARSLAARPFQLRTWAVIAIFELAGRRAPALHDQLSRRMAR